MRQLEALRVFQLEKKKREIECDLVKNYAICREEGINGKVMMPCLRWWRVRWQSISICLVCS